MVWHSYMLNPRWYAEDALRIAECSAIFDFGTSLGRQLHRLPELLTSPIADTRKKGFTELTLLPFCPYDHARTAITKTIKCPKCRRQLTVPYMLPNGTGYLQQNFQFQCLSSSCTKISKDSLCSRKLAENLCRIESDKPISYLPGLLFNTFDGQSAYQKRNREIIEHARSAYSYKTIDKGSASGEK